MRWLNGITDSLDEFEQTPGDGEGQGSLACCSPWGHNELDITEQLKNNKIFYIKETHFKKIEYILILILQVRTANTNRTEII